MKLFKIISSLFTREPKSPMNEIEKTIRRMGYKAEGENTFVKINSSGRTYIWNQENGIKIKVYSNGYGESDFLPSIHITVDRLKQFIRENEL